MWRKMMNNVVRTCLLVIGWTSFQFHASAAEDLAKQAVAILSQRCHACHGVEFRHDQLDVLQESSLLSTLTLGNEEIAYIEPGDPEASWVCRKLPTSRCRPGNR